MVIATKHEGYRRAGIVQAALVPGVVRKQLAANHGVNRSTLNRWVQACRELPPEQWPDALRPSSASEGGEVRRRMWQAARMLKAFTVPRLAAVAVAKVPHVARYVGCLRRTGYLRVGHGEEHGRRVKAWTLIRDTGPFAPVLQRGGAVYDPNLKIVFEEVAHG